MKFSLSEQGAASIGKLTSETREGDVDREIADVLRSLHAPDVNIPGLIIYRIERTAEQDRLCEVVLRDSQLKKAVSFEVGVR